MKLTFATLAVTIGCSLTTAQVSSPKIGVARYSDGSFHSVEGLPNNMIVADLPLDPAQAASFSDAGGIIAQNGAIRLLRADFSIISEYSISEKPLLSMDGEATSALAWLPQSHLLLHWNGSHFDSFGLAESDIQGTVTDLQSSGPKQARLIVEHSDKSVSSVIVSLRNGNLVSSETLPGVTGYTFGQGHYLVFKSGTNLVVDNLRGYRRTLTLPPTDLTMERMSNSWLHVYSRELQQDWALHLTQAELNVSMLPGLPQHSLTSTIRPTGVSEK